MADLRAVIVSAARDYVRRQVPYIWGGDGGGGVDCSGLVLRCYAQAGLTIGRTTWDEVKECRQITEAEAQPGDLVIFDINGVTDHVGIVSGPGMMIDAPREGLTVREEAIWTSYPLGYYRHPGLDVEPAQTQPEASLPVGGLAQVAGEDGVRVRAAPTLRGELRAVLVMGTRVLVGPSTEHADGRAWQEVAFVTGDRLLTGWVASEYLEALS